MTYAIIGSGTVGTTLARFFAAKDIPVLIANSRGPDTLAELATEMGSSVTPVSVEDAVEADVILVAVGSVAFKTVGALRDNQPEGIRRHRAARRDCLQHPVKE